MALRMSTGLVNKLLDTSSFKTLFVGCFIDIFSGTQPASPNDVPVGTKLATIYSNGTSLGLSFGPSAAAGVLSKTVAETWSQSAATAGGTAGWFRMREALDTGLLSSTTAVRMDGAIATSGAEMNLGSLTITAGAPVVISAAAFTLPQS